MTRLPDPQDFLDEVSVIGPTRSVIGLTPTEVLAADARRIRVIVATNLEGGAVAPDNEMIQIGTGSGSRFRAFASLSHQTPSIVLTIEEFGQLICGSISCTSPSANNWNVDVSAVYFVRKR